MNGSESLIQNLTKLEINTIIKDGMTARKMPDPANALLDIALSYSWKMTTLGVPLGRWFELKERKDIPKESGKKLEELEKFSKELAELSEQRPAGFELVKTDHGTKFDRNHVRIDVATFLCLRWAAATALRGDTMRGGQRILLERVIKNSDQLKNMLWRLDKEERFLSIEGKNRAALNALDSEQTAYGERKLLMLDIDDATNLRKIWEIGVEEIVAQTTIDLDGDTVTRIARKYASPGQTHALELHRLGIETAVGYWKGVMDALGKFITELVKHLKGSKS